MEEKKRLTANERQTFMHMVAAMEAFEYMKPLETLRFSKIRGGKWLFRTGAGIIKKLYAETLATIPKEQRDSILRNLHGFRYSLHVANVNGKDMKNDGHWLSWSALNAITDATRDHCITCSKDIQQQRTCPLAKALDELPCINADENARGCRYFGGLY